MAEDWRYPLQDVVRDRRLAVIQFHGDEWNRLHLSRVGPSTFTIARFQGALRKLRIPTACLLFCRDSVDEEARIGLIGSRSRVSALEARIKVIRAQRIQPSSKDGLFGLITAPPHARALRRQLASDEPVIVLSCGLSAHVIGKLAGHEANQGPVRAVAEALAPLRPARAMASLRQDAVRTALRVFGLSSDRYLTAWSFSRDARQRRRK